MSNGNARRIEESDFDQKRAGQTGGRLIGWLISYALDARGRAYEIRSGRILLAPKQINNQRVINLEGPGISLPHAVLHANKNHEVFIQDVFSENGTYVCHAGSDKEFSVEGPVQLQHGDWIRFGTETKFQICLIDEPGS